MTHKKVQALKIGSIALSGGISHFNPQSKKENGRYQRAILPAEDAARAEKRGLVKIVGDATQADYDKWRVDITSDVGTAAAERIEKNPVDSPAVANKDAISFPPNTAAVNPALHHQIDPDAPPMPGAPKDEGEGEGSLIDLSVAKMKPELDKITDPAVLQQLRDGEVKGKNRDSALEVIDDRIKALEAEKGGAGQGQ